MVGLGDTFFGDDTLCDAGGENRPDSKIALEERLGDAASLAVRAREGEEVVGWPGKGLPN